MYVFPTLLIELSVAVPVVLAVPPPPRFHRYGFRGCSREEPANKDKL